MFKTIGTLFTGLVLLLVATCSFAISPGAAQVQMRNNMQQIEQNKKQMKQMQQIQQHQKMIQQRNMQRSQKLQQ